MIPKALRSTKCAKCGGFKLDRPDHIPFCSECERKMTAEFAQKIRPDMAKKGEIELRSEAIKKV